MKGENIITIQVLSVEKMDEYEGSVLFQINGNEYKAFFFGEEFISGESVVATFDHLETSLEWDTIFNKNTQKLKKLVTTTEAEWSYKGYGQIKAINPVVADFGDIQLDLGALSNDPNVIGAYIYWEIERLDVSRDIP